MTDTKRETALSTLLYRHPAIAWSVLLILHCAITWWNGYPILYSDTSTYLASGFGLEAPADRPITYGLLLTIFSLAGLSLLFVPLFQSLIYLYAIKKLCDFFFEKEVVPLAVCALSLAILLFTGFSWCLNLVLPDFFTPVGFICLFCILADRAKLRQQWLLLVIFFIASASHIANVVSYFIVIACVALIARWFFKPGLLKPVFIKLAALTGLLIISYVIMGSAISKSRHVFMMGNLAQKGILQRILSDSCGCGSFALCAYKDSIPKSFDYFVWNKSSPLYKLGGWKEKKQEYKHIIRTSFAQAEYRRMHLRESSRNFVSQLKTFGVGEGTGQFDEQTPLIRRIRKFIRYDNALCVNTKQYKGRFIFTEMMGINHFYTIAMALMSVLFVFLLAAKRRVLDSQTWLLITLTCVLVTGTSVLVALTAEVSNRYGCRMAWLIVLLNGVMLIPHKSGKQEH